MPGYRHVGGGWYEMDDGTKVQGKAAAQELAASGGGSDADEGGVDHEHLYRRGRTAEGKQMYFCYDQPEISFEGCGHSFPR